MRYRMREIPQVDTTHCRTRFEACRANSLALATGLSEADQTVQSMPDASPTKWHLAHTTWFFETFVVIPNLAGYVPFDERFSYLFNSYYEQAGPRHPRPHRGMLTRPSAQQVKDYRAHVDEAMGRLFDSGPPSPAVAELIELGCQHEEQHQELILTDILHLFAQNPLRPAFRLSRPIETQEAPPLGWIDVEGGVVSIGHDGDGFAFDNETPRHEVLLRPFRVADRPVTNGEWLDFIENGGYATAPLWLSEGWAAVNQGAWQAPLYWERRDGAWWTMTLHGMQPINSEAPVTHISYYEADAFARWAGKRLPTEQEWEWAGIAGQVDPAALRRPASVFLPRPAAEGPGLKQMFGEVWQWCGSAYLGYPGYRPAVGAIGEYNGKFMCGQFVLRGSSCATPPRHARLTYRNFFYPQQRWQFTGLRLAEDAR